MNSELIAIPVFHERISPLLDEARRFALFEIVDGTISQKIVITVDLETDAMRICKLKDMGVTAIVCGVVSGYLSRFIVEKGLRHYPWVNGPADEIIQLYIKGELAECHAGMRKCEGKRRAGCCITWENENLIKKTVKGDINEDSDFK
ncbi:MAG TPA: hypothetical protein PK358_08880 [Spirochaetota bacterium]|nr:hypothetical protein [Spirochaetota bacterium]HPJ34933.1 hypothetical protein [Spirochaetota bacterium]